MTKAPKPRRQSGRKPRAPGRRDAERDVPAPPYARLQDDFFGPGGHVFVMQRPGERGPGVLRTETGRTVVRNRCRITAFFGLAVWGTDRRKDQERAKIRFANAQPELWLTSNGAIGIRINVAEVATTPGTLTIEVTREGGGAVNPPSRVYAANDITDLQRQLTAARELLLEAPATNPTNRRVVLETVTAKVSWQPAEGEGCSVTPAETLRLRWEHAGPAGRFDFGLSRIERVRRERTAVAAGRTIVGRREPDGSIRHGVPVFIYFAIQRAGECCGVQRPHAVIQFVRHIWDLGENPRKQGADDWSLDILDSEIARAGNGQSYDPTFTHNPRGTAPNANPLVHEGPDDSGALSLVQEDHPGISTELLNRFRRAPAIPSTFTFHFLSVLVCQLDPSDAAAYLANGTVKQSVEYQLTFRFKGADREPEIETTYIAPGVRHYDCVRLADVVGAEDRRPERRGQGKLRDGYARPRPHRVAIPA